MQRRQGVLTQHIEQKDQTDAADAVIQIGGETAAQHIDAQRQNPLTPAQQEQDAKAQYQGEENARLVPAADVECANGAERMLKERYLVHGAALMVKPQRVEGLGDEHEQHHAGEIPHRIARIHRADGHAVGEHRERQPADQPHFRNVGKEHFTRVVHEHEQAGQQADEPGIAVGAHCPRAGQGEGKRAGARRQRRERRHRILLTGKQSLSV